MMLAKARIVNYDRNCSFMVRATVITIVNYDRHLFIVQATRCRIRDTLFSSQLTKGLNNLGRLSLENLFNVEVCNTLTYWTHSKITINELLRIRPYNFSIVS
jgi:hypothetical protein